MKICLVSCFFGNIPPYFDLFLHSCGCNTDIDFVIFSDFELSANKLPPNVRIFNSSISAFKELASRKLNLEIEIEDPYKLNDYKPAYGVIFDDVLAGYDFWGYTDIDLIFGNVRRMLADEILDDYDVISVRKEFTSGFFCLYRNISEINTLFKSSIDYKTIFQNKKHFCFDECNFAYQELFKGKSILDINTDVQSMTYVVANAVRNGLIRARFVTIVIEFDPKLIWQNEGLFSADKNEEFLLFHLINFKNSKLFKILPIDRGRDKFYITKSGISSSNIQKWMLHIRSILVFLQFYLNFFFNSIKATFFGSFFKKDFFQLAGNYRLKNSRMFFNVFVSDWIYVRLPDGTKLKLLYVGNREFISSGKWMGRSLHFFISFSEDGNVVRVNYLYNCVSMDKTI